ncbi:hypothetical protein FRC06_009570 [Ceratobasidium sp. 370]|nr:hypothetical protein FRC06_009570 [Ceratobasidium sp. 370]
MCRDPNPPDPGPQSDITTIVIKTTDLQTHTYEVTQTYQMTQTYQVTRTVQAGSPSAGSATVGSENKPKVGIIAGGAAAGVVVVVILVIAIVTWYHRVTARTSTTGAQPEYPSVPSGTDQHGGVPPTPSSGDVPSLRPMVQRQNFGVPRFNGAPAPGSLAPTAPSDFGSDTGPYNASYNSGLPEPQQNAASGPTMDMPTPRYNLSPPRPLPMTVERIQQPQAPIVRPWSGFAQPSGANSVPYAENNNSQPSGWTAPADNEQESLPQARNSPQSGSSARRLPSIYQPSSQVAHSPLGSPPGSPPLPELYGSIAAGRSGGGDGELPVGAPSPTGVYGSEEKRAYVPYQ